MWVQVLALPRPKRPLESNLLVPGFHRKVLKGSFLPSLSVYALLVKVPVAISCLQSIYTAPLHQVRFWCLLDCLDD